MTGESQFGESPKQTAEAYYNAQFEHLADAVELFGHDRATDPRNVFPAPPEDRATALEPNLSEEDKVSLREVAGRAGIGGEVDVKSTATHQLIEGGKPWKVAAEVEIADLAETLIFTGSPKRKIGDNEKAFLAKRLPEDVEPAETEYGMVRQIAATTEGFEPSGEVVLPFGYDLTNGHALIEEPTGQFVQIGTIEDKPVIIMRTDRDDENKTTSGKALKVLGDILEAQGDQSATLGIVTGSGYALRVPATMATGLKDGREIQVAMYGRQTITDIQGKGGAEPFPLNQIPGELHVLTEKLVELKEAIDQMV